MGTSKSRHLCKGTFFMDSSSKNNRIFYSLPVMAFFSFMPPFRCRSLTKTTPNFLMAAPNTQVTIPNYCEFLFPKQYKAHPNKLQIMETPISCHACWLQPWRLCRWFSSNAIKNHHHNNATSPNPAYSTWLHQDKLIFSAITGSLSTPIILLLQCASPFGWSFCICFKCKHFETFRFATSDLSVLNASFLKCTLTK